MQIILKVTIITINMIFFVIIIITIILTIDIIAFIGITVIIILKDLEISFKSKHKQVEFINIVISTLGVFDSSSVDFLEMLEGLEFDQTCRYYAIKKIIVIAVRFLTASSAEGIRTGTITN